MPPSPQQQNYRDFILSNFHPATEWKGGEELAVNCTNHSDRKQHLYINTRTGLFFCHVCHYKGHLNKLASKLGRKLVTKAVTTSYAGARDVVQLPSSITLPPHTSPLKPHKIKNSPQAHLEALEYLYSRDWTPQMVKKYSLSYCYGGRFAERLIIPFFEKKKLVFFLARAWSKRAHPKVLNPSDKATEVLFNIDRIPHRSSLAVCEGVFDAVAVHETICPATCLLGKNLSANQLGKISSRKPKSIYVCLDGDAIRDAIKLATQLTYHFDDVRIVRLPYKSDPASLTRRHLEESFRRSRKFTFTQIYA